MNLYLVKVIKEGKGGRISGYGDSYYVVAKGYADAEKKALDNKEADIMNIEDIVKGILDEDGSIRKQEDDGEAKYVVKDIELLTNKLIQ